MVRIQIRRGTAAQWTSADPILAAGELGVETDTLDMKVGDGSIPWTSLPYVTGEGGSGITDIVADTSPQLGGNLDLNGHTVGAATAADLVALHATGGVAASTTLYDIPTLKIDIAGNAIPADTVNYLAATYTLNGVTMPGEIRGRGNSTWTQPKKPFRIKLTTAAALLGMPSNKHWSLLANYFDPSQIRNAIGLDFGARMSGLAWTPKFRYVDVVLNGVYNGVYQLVEHIRFDSTRMNYTAASGTTGLPLTGAYSLEMDRYTAGTNFFVTTHDGLTVICDDPDGSNATQKSYIQTWINDFETLLYDDDEWLHPTTGYRSKINVASFIDWYLLHELIGTVDAGFHGSVKFVKTRDTATVPGVLVMGPIWDMDLALGKAFNTTYAATGWIVRATTQPTGDAQKGATWIKRMIEDDTDFAEQMWARWLELITLFSDYEATVDYWAQRTAISRNNDSVIWPVHWGSNVAWRDSANTLKTWLGQRLEWISANLEGNPGDEEAPTVPTGLAGSEISGIGFTATWSASTDNVIVSGYQIRLDGGTAIDKTARSHAFIGLLPETEYDIEVRARDAAGNFSAWSSVVTVETGPPEVVPDPLFDFTFSEGSGSYTTDAVSSSTMFVTAWGTGVITDQATIQYASTYDTDAVTTSTQWSLALRAKLDTGSLSGSGDQVIMTYATSAGTGNALFVQAQKGVTDTGKLKLYYNTVFSPSAKDTTGFMDEDVWAIIALTFDGTDFIVYLDGAEVFSETVAMGYLNPSLATFGIGAGAVEVDRFRHWDLCLTAGQVYVLTA